MEEKLFDLIGLGVPFYLAAATYGVFSWLDNNASDEATKVISAWLRGRSQHKPDLGNLIIRAFDRIYTSPLLSFRAFRRSSAISTLAWGLLVLVPALVYTPHLANDPRLALQIVLFIVITILADFVSLPFVRHFLELGRVYPIRASVISSIVGIIIISIGTACLYLLVFVTYLRYAREHHLGRVADVLGKPIFWLALSINTMRPAFIIHLWLPLFSVSSLVVKLVYLGLRAVEKAQWFLKQGDAHPFKAIGIVATIIVFGCAILLKEAWAVL